MPLQVVSAAITTMTMLALMGRRWRALLCDLISATDRLCREGHVGFSLIHEAQKSRRRYAKSMDDLD